MTVSRKKILREHCIKVFNEKNIDEMGSLEGLSLFPSLLQDLAGLLADDEVEFDYICPVDKASLPLATAFSIQSKTPLVELEQASVAAGHKVYLVQGLMSDGKSALNAAERLKDTFSEVVKVSSVVLNSYWDSPSGLDVPDSYLELLRKFNFTPVFNLEELSKTFFNMKPLHKSLTYDECSQKLTDQDGVREYNDGKLIVAGNVDFANEIVTLFTSGAMILPINFDSIENIFNQSVDFAAFEIRELGREISFGAVKMMTTDILRDFLSREEGEG